MKRLWDDDRALQGAAVGLAGILFAVVLMSTATQAFAEKREGIPEETAFALGHVLVECVEEGESGNGEDPGINLVVGEPQERRYRISNQGEASYIRLASRTVLGDLEHPNERAVVEEVVADDGTGKTTLQVATSEEEGELGGDDGSVDEEEPSGVAWHLAADGSWYRPIPLEIGQSITVRVSVEVPFDEEWIAALNTGKASAVVEMLDVEALQARNKAIDLDSADPWGVGEQGTETKGEERVEEEGEAL